MPQLRQRQAGTALNSSPKQLPPKGVGVQNPMIVRFPAWSPQALQEASAQAAEQLCIPLDPSTTSTADGECSRQASNSGKTSKGKQAAKAAAAAADASAAQGPVFAVLLLVHDKGVVAPQAWTAYEQQHQGRVVVRVHLKAGISNTKALRGGAWIKERMLHTRVRSEWGETSLTRAILEASAELLQLYPTLQHVALASGQCLPVAAIPQELPVGVSFVGLFGFGRAFDKAAGREASRVLQQQLCMSQEEAQAWGDAITFHHTWMALSRDVWLALISKQQELLQVAEVLNERFMMQDAAVAADEFMLPTAAVRYGFVRGVVRQRLHNLLATHTKVQRQQSAAAAAGSGSSGDKQGNSSADKELHLQLPDAAAATGAAVSQQRRAAVVRLKRKRSSSADSSGGVCSSRPPLLEAPQGSDRQGSSLQRPCGAGPEINTHCRRPTLRRACKASTAAAPSSSLGLGAHAEPLQQQQQQQQRRRRRQQQQTQDSSDGSCGTCLPQTGSTDSAHRLAPDAHAAAAGAGAAGGNGGSPYGTEGTEGGEGEPCSKRPRRSSRVVFGRGPGKELVGCHIDVLWPRMGERYTAKVTYFNSSINQHTLCYDDGDREVLDLRHEDYVLDPADVAAMLAKKAAAEAAAAAKQQRNSRGGGVAGLLQEGTQGLLVDCTPTLALFHPTLTRHPLEWSDFDMQLLAEVDDGNECRSNLTLLEALGLVQHNHALFFRKVGQLGRSDVDRLAQHLQQLWRSPKH